MAQAQPPTVFVVDDDEVVRDSLNALLQSRQFEVVEFPSGRAFLEGADLSAVSCLIADIHMPEMTGLELLQTLRERGHEIPTILITGRNDPAIAARARELRAVALLDKPVPHGLLFGAVEKALT